MFQKNYDFPFIERLEEVSHAIIAETKLFIEDNSHRFIHWKAKDIGLDGWDIFGFNWMKREFKDNMSFFPITMQILSELPEITMCTLSRLAPHKAIQPHVGYEDNTLRINMGLIVPDGCTLTVGNETRKMEAGKVLLFDDTTLHSARNDSDFERIVLLADFPKVGKNFIEPLTKRTNDVLYKMHDREWKRKRELSFA